MKANVNELVSQHNAQRAQYTATVSESTNLSSKLEAAYQKLIGLTKTYQLKEQTCDDQEKQIKQLTARATSVCFGLFIQ
jgi:hypothetical protein